MIKGIEKLNQKEIDFIQEVNQNQKKAFGSESDNYDIIEVWKDKNNVICVRLFNNDWYHYQADMTWY